jgi:hypothetical protein
MNSTDTKSLRLRYHNQWPTTFHFPIEQKLLTHLASLNISSTLMPAPLAHSADSDFHRMLSALLDGLDMLPLRPDRAFESIWAILDAEMERLKAQLNPPSSPSRFAVFMGHIEQTFVNSPNLAALIGLMSEVPMQSCEYVASRILEAMNQPGKHSDYFLAKVRPPMGPTLLDAFNTKYGPQWLAAHGDARSVMQRKAGAFLKKLLTGSSICVGPLVNHSLTPAERLRFFVYAVLPAVRNERFHGLNFSSYRSSAAQMKTYAAGYFLLLISYSLLLHVFLYRQFGVIDAAGVNAAIVANRGLYIAAFGKFASD